MDLVPAPYFGDVAYGPENGAAYWAQTPDGVRIRLGLWPLSEAKGTVLIFPGRTEFIEKYGQIAQKFAQRGLASAAVDWRGQGLADRLLENPLIGHVEHFRDYQKDAEVLMRTAQEMKLPRPYFMLAHSMGGAIGLRSLISGFDFTSVAFSAPMWGIQIAPHLRVAAWVLSHSMPRIGQGHRLPPGSRLDHHVLIDGFEGNLLTRDAAQFEIMRQQLLQHPELSLGGPSFVWLREALQETRQLSRMPSPDFPCLTLLGTNERIVEIDTIQRRMSKWRNGRLDILPEGEHEVLMEGESITEPLFDQITAHYLATADA